MTIEETSKLITSVMKMWPSWGDKRDIETTVKLWQRAFADDDARLVGQALGVYFTNDTSGFAPSPGHLKEILMQMRQGEDEQTEMEAWGQVYRAICNSAYNSAAEFAKLPPVCQQVIGDPETLHDWALMDADEVQTVVASNFQRSYRERAKHHREWEKLPESMKSLLPVFRSIGRLPDEKPAALPAEDTETVPMPEAIREQLAAMGFVGRVPA